LLTFWFADSDWRRGAANTFGDEGVAATPIATACSYCIVTA